MRRLAAVLCLGLCLFLYGCPYESDVPMDEPRMQVDSGFIGKWKHVDDEKSYATVNIQGDFIYRMVYNSWTSEHRSYKVQIFSAHLSVLSGSLFVNFRPDMKTGGSYYICEFETNATRDTIRLRPVSADNKKKFTNSVELREWVVKKMKKKNFFDKEEIFVKVP